MATIQIREVPEEAYEVLRRRARAEGRSIQAYMRDRVVELASTPSKEEVVDRIEQILLDLPGHVDRTTLLSDLEADRR